MGKLDGKAGAGRGNGLRRLDDPCQRRFIVVRIKAEAFVRDAADAFDGSGFDDHHAGAPHGKLHQVLKMPIGRAAVRGGILAHGRDGNAIGQRKWSHLEGVEKIGHWFGFLW